MQKYKNLFSQVKILEGHRLPRPEPLDLIDQVIVTGTGTDTEAGNMFFWPLSLFMLMHERCQLVIPWRPTEYIQSGNFRFLACNPSWWKNQPWLVRVEGARPPPGPFTLLPSSTKLQYTLQLRGQIRSPYLVSTLYVLCGSALSCYLEKVKFTYQKTPSLALWKL